MAATLKDTLVKQQTEKKQKKDFERADDKFKFQFPFEIEALPFKITPKNQNMYGTVTHDINLFKELPLQFDIQATQNAHRNLKDYQKLDTIKSAQNRMHSDIEHLRQ